MRKRDRQADTKTDRQTDRHTDTQTDNTARDRAEADNPHAVKQNNCYASRKYSDDIYDRYHCPRSLDDTNRLCQCLLFPRLTLWPVRTLSNRLQALVDKTSAFTAGGKKFKSRSCDTGTGSGSALRQVRRAAVYLTGVTGSLICKFCLRVAACRTISADPFVRSTLLLLWGQAKKTIQGTHFGVYLQQVYSGISLSCAQLWRSLPRS